jgi:hypothetical protein
MRLFLCSALAPRPGSKTVRVDPSGFTQESFSSGALTGLLFRPRLFGILTGSAFFCATKCAGSGFVEKMQLGVMGLGDYSTALEYEPSNIVGRTRGGEVPFF